MVTERFRPLTTVPLSPSDTRDCFSAHELNIAKSVAKSGVDSGSRSGHQIEKQNSPAGGLYLPSTFARGGGARGGGCGATAIPFNVYM